MNLNDQGLTPGASRIASARAACCRLVRLAAILLLSIHTATAANHPGLISSQADLDYMRAMVNGTADHPMKDGWNVMRGTRFASLSYNATPYPVVHVVGSGANNEERALRDDAVAAYAHALQWVVTGNSQHAEKAIQIMNAWSLLQDIVPESGSPRVQDSLEAAWYAPIWLSAAEIIRHYNNGAAGWSSSQINQFGSGLVRVFHDKVTEWAGSFECCPNQTISVALARVSIGVYLDDHALFNDGVGYFRDRILPDAIRSNGEVREVNRIRGGDCGHATYNIEGMFNIAEIAWKQGVNLYAQQYPGDTTPRMLKGLEYCSQLIMSGANTSTEGFVHCARMTPASIEIAYNHYVNRGGDYALPQTANLLFNKVRPSNQGTGKFIPWDTLTHADLSAAGNSSGSNSSTVPSRVISGSDPVPHRP